ncbi:FadR/GntR family transcriptional regulator [Paracoccus sp. SCSIO 75233]|uniref:FadR/GntR family transcriptional regulator n=1 Tax=Paracoccus sp. SCSIO 75233 TaxID=3017782 RepID=UPI0022F07E04|nr:FadR/GntR family transcriptional regulator [Paracoccus sp. SCSIO 75233]WBU52026.1 FadR/GntR family transcriptional regulator [Paracoccus sp. SCSIO 75233]
MSPKRVRPKLSDVLHADLLEEINSGRLGEGARLPSEAELGQRFSVSRPIVREALRRLREDGIIRSKKGSGSYVVPHSTPGRSLGRGGPMLSVASIADIQKLFQFRFSLEGEIAWHAAEQRTDDDIERISRAAEALGQSRKEDSDGTEEDIAFHMAIARATGNPFFVRTLESLTADMRFIVELARGLLMQQTVKAITKVQSEHEVIVSAIRDRDPEAARHHMKFHLRTAQERLFYGSGRDGAFLWRDEASPAGVEADKDGG